MDRKAKQREYSRKYREANPEACRQSVLDCNRRAREADLKGFREKQRAATARWRAANPEKAREVSIKSNRKYRDSNREKLRLRSKDAHLRKTYGLSRLEYEAMVEAQSGLCAICKENKFLHIDHCHSTDKVRGLLCYNCNVAIGHLRDDPVRIMAAHDYIRKAEKHVDTK